MCQKEIMLAKIYKMKIYFKIFIAVIFMAIFWLPGSGCKKKETPAPVPPVVTPATYVGFKVVAGNIVDKDGTPWIPYGVNSVHVWLNEDNALNALSVEIPKTKANIVRLVTSGSSWTWNSQSITAAQKRNLIQKAIAAGLVPMMEMHDATCLTVCSKAPADGKMGVKEIVDEWLSPPMLAVLKEFEGKMIINIANEWGDNNIDWFNCYKEAITRFRLAGIRSLIAIDAGGNCGQNPESLLTWGNALFDSDPEKNIMLSVHLYGFWRTADRTYPSWTPPNSVEEVIPKLAALNAPVVIGEFGWDKAGGNQNVDVNFNPKILLQTCKANGMGWIFWGWYDGADRPFYNTVNTGSYQYNTDADLSDAGAYLINDAMLGFKNISKKPAGF